MKSKADQYIIRKYVMAKSALGAIRQDKKTPVHDCWIDEDWKKQQNQQLESCIGFSAEHDEDEEEE